MTISEFKPTIFFLLKFVGIFVLGNLLYGLYITSFEPKVDPVTHSVTEQTAIVLQVCGYNVGTKDRENKPTTDITHFGKGRLAVYEGCNGINTSIVFIAFLLAFGPISRTLLWFVPIGLLIIHFTNLARIALLFLVSLHLPKAMYFTHKYLFTAIIYAVVFCLWIWWVRAYSLKTKSPHVE